MATTAIMQLPRMLGLRSSGTPFAEVAAAAPSEVAEEALQCQQMWYVFDQGLSLPAGKPYLQH